MKNFVLVLFALLLANSAAFAGSRFYTIQSGIPSFYGTTPTGNFVASSSCDPFMVKIDGIKYYMMYSGSNNPGLQTLLGCSGMRKIDFFTPLRDLESDGDDLKITGEELKKAGIRLVASDIHNTLLYDKIDKDFDMNKVSYIDMSRLRITPAAVGYGSFDLYIKKENGNLKKIIGKVFVLPTRRGERMFD